MTLLSLLRVLVTTVLLALSAAGLVPLVRVVPWVRRWVEQGRRPWACDICMAFWGTLLAGAFWWGLGAPWSAVVPAYALTLFLVRRNSDPMHKPHGVPELLDINAHADLLERAHAELRDREP